MISATAYENHIELTILSYVGKTKFSEDLVRIKSDILFRDRHFDPDKKVWVITNLKDYAHLPYIAHALDMRKCQPNLF